MDHKIKDALTKLRKEAISPEEALDVLTEQSIHMMRHRDEFLRQGRRRKARDIHVALARYYRRAATLVPSEKKELFSLLSDYWYRGGENFWEPSSFEARIMPPSRTHEKDHGISTPEYEERKGIARGEEQAEASGIEQGLSIELGQEQSGATETKEKVSIELADEVTRSMRVNTISGE